VCCEGVTTAYCTDNEEACARNELDQPTWFYSCLSPADCGGSPCGTVQRGFTCIGREIFPDDSSSFACIRAADCPRFPERPAPRCERVDDPNESDEDAATSPPGPICVWTDP